MRLLLVEDHVPLADELSAMFQRQGYAVDWLVDGKDALWQGANEPYDLIVLDLGLPRKSGLEILREWRANQLETPVLILTARDSWVEKIDGLKAGADDYLTKPFHMEELLLRIQALLRRSHGRTSQARLIVGAITLDEEKQQALFGNEEISLTGAEFRLLRYFMLHPQQLLSKTRLSEHLYDGETEHNSNVLEVLVKRLRNKFGQECIQTHRGQGYAFHGCSSVN